MMLPTYLWYISLVIFTLCVILILFSNNKAIRTLKGSYNRQP
jgi:ABC-type siderophore export system fused ATPase/permease subunit